MRLLCDENIARVLVVALREQGHDVVWMRTAKPGSSDREVAELARRESRILITHDLDFGELAVRKRLPFPPGAILLRVRAPGTEADASALAHRISARDDWAGHFSVIEPSRIRMRDIAALS